jgi:hypothetical protein
LEIKIRLNKNYYKKQKPKKKKSTVIVIRVCIADF